MYPFDPGHELEKRYPIREFMMVKAPVTKHGRIEDVADETRGPSVGLQVGEVRQAAAKEIMVLRGRDP